MSKSPFIGRGKIVQQLRPGVLFLDPVTLRPIPQPVVVMQRFERDDHAAEWQADLGRKVAAAREAADLSQAQLARRSGLRQPHISAIEAGQHDLRVTTVFTLARALGVKADRLFPSTSGESALTQAKKGREDVQEPGAAADAIEPQPSRKPRTSRKPTRSRE